MQYVIYFLVTTPLVAAWLFWAAATTPPPPPLFYLSGYDAITGKVPLTDPRPSPPPAEAQVEPYPDAARKIAARE